MSKLKCWISQSYYSTFCHHPYFCCCSRKGRSSRCLEDEVFFSASHPSIIIIECNLSTQKKGRNTPQNEARMRQEPPMFGIAVFATSGHVVCTFQVMRRFLWRRHSKTRRQGTWPGDAKALNKVGISMCMCGLSPKEHTGQVVESMLFCLPLFLHDREYKQPEDARFAASMENFLS